MTYKEFLKKIGEDSSKNLTELCSSASKNGLKVKVRTFKNNCGDFCIFIYDKSVKSSYIVGFDGYYNSKDLSIDACIDYANSWLSIYLKEKKK